MNNYKSAGATSQSCDAIQPIGGIDASGYYKALNINAAGGIASDYIQATSGSILPLAPNNIATTVGAKAAGTYLGSSQVNTANYTSAGIYRLISSIIVDTSTATGTGKVNLIFYSTTSALGTYVATLAAGVDAFTPTLSSLLTGLHGYSFANTLFAFGTGNIQAASLVTTNVYIAASTNLYCAVVTNTALTLSGNAMLYGNSDFSRIGNAV